MNTRSDSHATSFHANVPLLVWDGTQYQLDYNHNHRPISVWDGATHTDIVYDDDDDYDGRTDYDYAYGDSFNMNDPSVRLQFEKCLQTVQFQKRLQATSIATPQASPQQKQPHKHTTMTTTKTTTHTHEDPQPPYTYNPLQLLFLTTHYETKSNDSADDFPLYTVPHYITRKKHPGHDNYLYRRWNNPTARSTTKKTHKTNQRNFARSTTTVSYTHLTLPTTAIV